MVDRKNCDRIVVESNAKMEKVIQWYLSNKEWIDNIPFRSPIPSALIELKEEGIDVCYEPDGDSVMLYIWSKSVNVPNGVYVCKYSYNPHTHSIGSPQLAPGLSPERERLLKIVLKGDNTLYKEALKYHALMSFAAHYENVVEVSEKRRNSISKTKAKKIARKSGREVSLYSTVYKLPDNATIDKTIASAPRHYTKPTEAVNVKGHYRTCKSGKRVWVKPFTKYKDKPTNSKTYRL